MASFAKSLQTFRNGYISYDDLLQELDRIIAEGRADASRLLAILREEEAKSPLPADISSALRDKLKPLSQKTIDFAEVAKEKSKSLYEDNEGTQLAHVFQPNSFKAPDIDTNSIESIAPNDDDIDQIKSTGDVLSNRFELQTCIGSSSIGSVYKALDRVKEEANDPNLYVAIKLLNFEFQTDPVSLVALRREVKKCQILVHPNIVRVYGLKQDGASVYMTMEFLSGLSLGRKMREPFFTGIPKDEALRIINDSGQALRHAHDSGFVHADFKPSNVFITKTGRIKVIDFGIARAMQQNTTVEMETARFDPSSLQELSLSYASPQILERQKPDPRDDIYALACTAYEILTGSHPFGRVPANVARERGVKLPRHKALTGNQFTALKHALEFDRDKRTATIDQFLQELDQKTGINGKKRTIVVSLIGLVLAVLAGYYYLSGTDENQFSGNTTRDKKSTEKPTVEIDSLKPSRPSADFASVEGGQKGIERTTRSQMSSDIDLEMMFDLKFWESIEEGRLEDYLAYLEAFPNGHFTAEARLRIAQLTQTIAVPGKASGADTKRTSKKEVARLLKSAEGHLKADRLMAPKFNNALFLYQKILRLDANNAAAQAGITKIKAKLIAFALDAQAQNDLETARSQLKKVLVIDPRDKTARAALRKLR